MKLFELYATLGLDTNQFDAGLNGAIQSTKGVRDALEQLRMESVETGRQGGQAASFFKSQWSDVQGSLNSVFAFKGEHPVVQGISSSISALKQLAGESINLASDLNEVQNVIDVTFGTDAAKIDSWAKRAKNSVGMSELAARQYVGTLGAMLKSSGMTGDAVADLSMQMVTLSGDMASFYNLDYDTAFQKIRSGISGETEPLKQLGINMSVANLEAFRLAEGIETAYDRMSQSEQVELRMKYLAQATKDASGDFERTAGSYANAKKTLEGNVDMIKADLGSLFLPIAENFMTTVNNIFAMFDGEDSVADRLEEIKSTFQLEEVSIDLDALTADSMIRELEALEQKTELTEEEQRRWMYLLRGLSDVIPDTAELIDLQTGTIEGGTEALRENTRAWEENRRTKALQTRLNSLMEEKAKAYDALTTNEQQTHLEQKKMEAAEGKLLELAKDYADEHNLMFDGTADSAVSMAWSHDLGENDPFGKAARTYYNAKLAIEELTDAHDGLQEAYEITSEAADEWAEGIEEFATSKKGLDEVTFSAEKYARAMENVANILKDVEEYQTRVTDATRSQVNSVVSGWKKLDDIDGYWGTDEKGEQKKLDLKEYRDALDSQIKFAVYYRENLEKLRTSDLIGSDLLSYFAANINEENAELLNAFANADKLSPEDQEILKRISELYTDRGIQSEALTQEASGIQLNLDSTYQQMLASRDEMLGVWEDQQTAYADAMANNMKGMDEQIKAALPTFQADADNIRDALASAFDLSYVTLHWPEIGGFLFGGLGGSGDIDGSHATGLDYVPYDGYVAQLHEGERVMTRLENYQFTRGEMGGGDVDASMIAQVVAAGVRDAMQGVGVYMDGVAVGHMVAGTISSDISGAAWAERYDG